ncbi:MAG: hypothetical protein ACRC4N_14790 [Gammaproteobacteria bacterium]
MGREVPRPKMLAQGPERRSSHEHHRIPKETHQRRSCEKHGQLRVVVNTKVEEIIKELTKGKKLWMKGEVVRTKLSREGL